MDIHWPVKRWSIASFVGLNAQSVAPRTHFPKKIPTKMFYFSLTSFRLVFGTQIMLWFRAMCECVCLCEDVCLFEFFVINIDLYGGKMKSDFLLCVWPFLFYSKDNIALCKRKRWIGVWSFELVVVVNTMHCVNIETKTSRFFIVSIHI